MDLGTENSATLQLKLTAGTMMLETVVEEKYTTGGLLSAFGAIFSGVAGLF